MSSGLESKFKVYSMGIVAEPKVLNSKIILVTPLETMPFYGGEIRSDPAAIKDDFVDKDGKPYAVEVLSDFAIKAEWLPINDGNRVTPPDVRRGERVILYRYADNDKFYWQSLGADTGKRRLETVLWRFSATTDESVTVLDDSNSYWLEISTHKQSITLQTSKANGEVVSFGVSLNGKDGRATIKDDRGNHFFIDSLANYVEFGNGSGSFVALDKMKALISADKEVMIKTKSFIVDAAEQLFKGNKFTINMSKFTANVKSFLMAGAGAFSGSLTHNGKKIDSTHKHNPPGGPVA